MALRTALTQPTAAARQAATLDQVSNGRLLVNVVAGGDAIELAGDGIFWTTTPATKKPASFSPSGASCWPADGEFLWQISHGERRAQFLPAGLQTRIRHLFWRLVAGGA